MKLKLIFANINGGKKFIGSTYGETANGDGILNEYIDIFKSYEADILSLAEVHLENSDQSEMVEEIAGKLGLHHHNIQGTAKSHLTTGKILGNAILSRFPIVTSDHFVIKAPAIKVERPNGDHWVLHDKGAQSITVTINGQIVNIANLQYFPFHHFNRRLDETDFSVERISLVRHLTNATATIVTGDFNNKNVSLEKAFPELFIAGFSEAIKTETTVVGDTQQLDHVLYDASRISVKHAEIIKIPSDHDGIFVEFELS